MINQLKVHYQRDVLEHEELIRYKKKDAEISYIKITAIQSMIGLQTWFLPGVLPNEIIFLMTKKLLEL